MTYVDRRLRRAHRRRARGAPRRRVDRRGRGRRDAVADDEEYRVRVRIVKRGGARRGRLQRHLAPGAQRINATPLDAKTTRRHRVQVPARPDGLVHLGHDPPDRHRAARRAR